jgi:nitrogen fixation-related uncharacterized protein
MAMLCLIVIGVITIIIVKVNLYILYYHVTGTQFDWLTGTGVVDLSHNFWYLAIE